MKTLIAGMLLVALLGGCARHTRVPVSNANVDLALEQSHTLIKAGETVTFTANASGIAGRREKVAWQSNGGDLDNPNNMSRYAQVRYRNPGTYSVKANLYVDGTLVDTEVATVVVEPLG